MEPAIGVQTYTERVWETRKARLQFRCVHLRCLRFLLLISTQGNQGNEEAGNWIGTLPEVPSVL
jgi:hypothetical protein